MKKRALAAVLWFYAFWYAGAMIADFLSVSAALGPIVGAAAAGLIAGDPLRVIWPRTPNTTNATRPTTGTVIQTRSETGTGTAGS